MAPEYAGDVPSPEDVLGFALGEQEVTPGQIEKLVAAVDGASDRVASGVAATSVAGRPLHYAVVGDLCILSIANVEHLGLEESRPLSLALTRVEDAGVTVEWASLPGP